MYLFFNIKKNKYLFFLQIKKNISRWIYGKEKQNIGVIDKRRKWIFLCSLGWSTQKPNKISIQEVWSVFEKTRTIQTEKVG